MLHLNPVLVRSQIRTALNSVPPATNPLSAVLSSSGLAEQIETIKITPATLGREEIAWIWTALKADYRPTFAFQASVVLIRPELPTSIGLPVLTRNVTAQPSISTGFAQLMAIKLAPGQNSAAQGDSVTVTGTGLGTVTTVSLFSVRLGIQFPDFAPTTVLDTAVTFTVPTDANKLPAGVYILALNYTDTSGATVSTNSLSIGLAAKIVTISATKLVSGTSVAVTCNPNIQALQSVSLALGSAAVPADKFVAPTQSLSFHFPTLPPKKYLARLQVDGVDSPVSIDFTATPPVFTGTFVTVT
jgi:hypothetical protein